MPESQNIEWKQSWKEDYLKWVCGFANAQGGTIYIGVDDQGQVFPLSNSQKLLEEIPNKIRTLLGLNIDVNLRNDGHGDYIASWGRGIEVIKESCAEAQLPPATFQEENGGVRVTLTSTLSEGANTGNEGANRSSEGATSGIEGAPDPEMMAHHLRLHYTRLDQELRSDSIAARAKILSALLVSPSQQAAEIAEAIQIGKSTVERHLAVLKQDGFVEIQGSGKSRAYHPTEKARKLREQDATS